MCGNFPLRVIDRGNYSGAVTLAAASPAHFTHSQPRPLSPCLEIVLSLQCVRLQRWMRFAPLFCWLDPLPALIGVLAPRPVATRQRFSSHIHRSATAASDSIPLVSFPCLLLTALLSVSRCGPDVCIVVYTLLLPITQLFTPVQMTIDRWQVDMHKNIHFLRFMPCTGEQHAKQTWISKTFWRWMW